MTIYHFTGNFTKERGLKVYSHNAFSRFFNISKNHGFEFDKPYIKKFGFNGEYKFKVVLMKCVKNSLIELDNKKQSVKGSVNDCKLFENIIRAKQRIFELAFCNPWDFFFTGTLNPKKYDRTDLNKFHKDFTQFIRDFNKFHNCNIKFLIVPELHTDRKSWHLHGFLYGLDLLYLKQFQIGDKMGKGIADKVLKGDIIYNWLAYSKKFGFCDLEPIRNHEAVSKYITKYINKELTQNVTELNAHLYYHSRGLSFAEKIETKKELIEWQSISPSFENEFCKLYWLDEQQFNTFISF